MNEIDVLLRDMKKYGNAGIDCMLSAEDALTIATALEAAREDAWQPIETAPKDGKEIWANDTSGLTSFCVAYWLSGNEWSGWVYEDDLFLDNNPLGPNPTHWRPLPAPPAIDQARGKGANDEA